MKGSGREGEAGGEGNRDRMSNDDLGESQLQKLGKRSRHQNRDRPLRVLSNLSVWKRREEGDERGW